MEELQQKKWTKHFLFINNIFFNLLNMPEIVRLHGSVKEIWEGVNESYLHPVKDQITVMEKN